MDAITKYCNDDDVVIVVAVLLRVAYSKEEKLPY